MPAVREAPSYSSARVQRASRINNIESTRLEQQLQCIERAKQHQCRLTNQDIRLVSLSLDYIQSSSGNSPEAWRPSDDESDTQEVESKPEGPCFLYGERIISRKMRRVTRPMSAVERVLSDFSEECSVVSDATSWSSRPKSSPGGKQHLRRPVSASGWARWRDNQETDDIDTNGNSESRQTTMNDYDRLSTTSSAFSPRPTSREAWEWDEGEVSLATKKLLKAQAVAQSGKKNSVYVSAGDVMTAQASRNVRNLARKIRLSTNPVMQKDLGRSPTRPVSRQSNPVDRPPQRPAGFGRDALGRRATIGEILNQHKPTLSAGAWRQHLRQSAINPASVSTQRQAMLDAKKEINESQRADVEQKVKSFMRGHVTPRWRRKSIFG